MTILFYDLEGVEVATEGEKFQRIEAMGFTLLLCAAFICCSLLTCAAGGCCSVTGVACTTSGWLAAASCSGPLSCKEAETDSNSARGRHECVRGPWRSAPPLAAAWRAWSSGSAPSGRCDP